MFEKHDRLPVVVERLTFRRKAQKEKDPTRIAEITVETELTRPLSKDISQDMDILFDGRGRPVPGTSEVDFNLAANQFVLRIRATERGKAQSVQGVTMRRLKAIKDDDNSPWRIRFTLAFTLLAPQEMETVLEHLFRTIFITLEEQEPSMLPDEPADAATDGAGEE